ncbi:hypothetical protein FRB90_009045, partial [Tulasnella sp. 427]
LFKFIERAQSSPLCVYSMANGSNHALNFDRVESALMTRQHQIRTLRLGDPSVCDFGQSLVLAAPSLRTFEAVRPPGKGFPADGFNYNNLRLRHLSLAFWRLPTRTVWSQGLATLVLRGLHLLDSSLFHMLGACAHSLRSLAIESTAPIILLGTADVISLPRLEELRLQMLAGRTAANIMQKIQGPRSMSGIVHTILYPDELNIIEDLSSFLLPEGCDNRDTAAATVEIIAEKSPT